VQNKTNEVYNENFESHLINYRYLKRMKWWCWLLVLGGIVLGVGISFLVGYLTLNSSKMPHWQGTAWVALIITLLLILTILVLGYIRSKWALDFWNDRVKRYQKTYEDNEAKLLLIRKMVILITIGMLIMAIVTSILFF
jgi:MFS family permease